MNEAEAQEEILSREELSELLATLEDEGGPGSRDAARTRAADPAKAHSRTVSVSIMRAMEAFGDAESRRLSNLHQAAIRISLIGWREVEQWELAEAMLPSDRVALFRVEPSGAMGGMVIGRPLFFQLLCLGFGAQPGATRGATVPARPYTRIECRFFERLAAGFLEAFDRHWADVTPIRSKLVQLADRDRLLDARDQRIFYAVFDVRGFGEVCRLRVGLPTAPFAELEREVREAEASASLPVENQVQEMQLAVHAELGSVELPLSKVAGLQVGEVIPIEAYEDGELVVRIEDTPKFRGVAGCVGSRVAVQLTERVS